MKGTKAAVRYATSLMELAMEKGNLDSVANDMNYLHNAANENPELVSFFKSPIISSTKKLEVIKAVFEQFEASSMSFMELVVKNRREMLLPSIAETFGELVKEHKGIVSIELVTAVQLDEETRKNILAKIEESVKGTLEVTETIDADIIGGYIVKMGDRRIDASVKSQFNKLKQTLTH
jgi:F-type H+-transporting ATPase subunit delta